jgi:WD40 repeat protein
MLTAGGRWLVVGVGTPSLRVFDASTAAPQGPALSFRPLASAAILGNDGRRLLVICPESSGRRAEGNVWELPTGRLVAGPFPDARLGTISSDGRLVALVGASQAVQVRNVDTGDAAGPDLKHERPVILLTFSPDSHRLASVTTGGADGRSWAQVWDVATGEAVTSPLQHEYQVTRLEFSPDGQRLLAAASRYQPGDNIGEGQVHVWDLSSGAIPRLPLRLKGAVLDAHFSADAACRWVVTASTDRTARVWDTETGEPRTPPLLHPNRVVQAQLSPDGRYVLTLSDGAMRVWEAATGAPLTPPLRERMEAQASAFGPEAGSVIAVGSGSEGKGRIELWDLRPDELPASAWARRARLLSGRYIDATGGLVPVDPEDLLHLLEKE